MQKRDERRARATHSDATESIDVSMDEVADELDSKDLDAKTKVSVERLSVR